MVTLVICPTKFAYMSIRSLRALLRAAGHCQLVDDDKAGSQPITGKLILTNDQGWWVVQSLSTFCLPKPQTVSALCVSTGAVGVVSNLPLICRVILHN